MELTQIYSYQPSHEDELELTLDQIIDYLGEVEDGWWKGRSQQTGQVLFLLANAIVCKPHHSRFAAGIRDMKVNRYNSM